LRELLLAKARAGLQPPGQHRVDDPRTDVRRLKHSATCMQSWHARLLRKSRTKG